VRTRWRYLGTLFLGVAALVLVLACGPKSPEEKVAGLRASYSARLNGFLIEEEPILPEVPATEETLAPEAEAGEVADAGEEVEVVMMEVPVKQLVRLDILIQHRSEERLPGVTVDISMADPAGQEKGHWRVWFDTADVPEATVTQFTHILEEVGYEEGDGFFVEVRHPVPAAERGDYREFAVGA
jgi:hypothetical protein